MINILVLCTGNSCRSQIAEGYLRYYAKNKANIYSAGVEAHGVNPMAVVIMNEDGIDITNQTSNNLEEYITINFDYVITVCDNAKERCPLFSGNAIKVHHNFFDSSKVKGTEKEIHLAFQKTRNECELISENVKKLFSLMAIIWIKYFW